MEEITFDKEGRDKLIEGINKLNRAVSSTLGPSGKTVIIPANDTYDEYIVTKDGVSVANSIVLKDPIENIGAKLIKQAAQNTVDEAGDGTTTSTVLATAFINNLKDFDTKDINKAFDEIIPKVIDELKKNSRQLNHEDIKYVATISANNDSQIGELIQQAYDFSNIIKVEEGGDVDELECVSGMSLDVTYFSKKFITNPRKAEVDLIEPYVLLLDGKLDNFKAFEQVIISIAQENKPLLIITEHVHDNPLRYMESNKLSGNLDVCIIKAPGYSKHRKDLLRDISDFTGASLITDFSKTYNTNILGKLKSVKVTRTNSILVKHDDVDITEFLDTLKELSKSTELEAIDKKLIDERIVNLTGKVATIKVGARSEIERKERKDRYDDAVLAVACALEEGIVEGGGKALYYSIKSFCKNIDIDIKDTISLVNLETIQGQIAFSLLSPYNKIIENGSKINLLGNMFDLNIIDPLKVTRCALENAASVAKTILSTQTIVLNSNTWKHQ